MYTGMRGRLRRFARARSEKTASASPGGAPRHFWAAVKTTSIGQASMRSGMPPVAQTPSTTNNAPLGATTFA